MKKRGKTRKIKTGGGIKFRSAGYFHRTVGAVNAETVKRYIEEGQKKHWAKEEKNGQKTLFNFSG